MWTRPVSHWLVSHLLSLSSVLYGSVQSKHIDCVSGIGVHSSVHLSRPLVFWLSLTDFHWLSRSGKCLGQRNCRGIDQHSPPNLRFLRRVSTGGAFLSFISFPCLPTLVVDLSTEVPLTFQWTTLAEEFCKAFPDYTHHMFLLHSVQLCFQGMIVIDVQGPTVRSLWHSPVCYTLLASIVHFLTVGMPQHSCSVEFVTQVVTVPLTEPSVSDLWRPAVAQSLCASYRPGCFTTPSLDLTCPIFQVALTAVAVWWRINIYNTYL